MQLRTPSIRNLINALIPKCSVVRILKKRTLLLLVSLFAFLYAGVSAAIGLGEITLKSRFNEPLRAEIRLLKVKDLDETEILVSLASRDDFRRAGVDRYFFLTELSYEVVLDNPSNPHIKVTSSKTIAEPYLNFLLDIQWPNGRLLREYTLLLDLPVFTDESPSAVASPTRSSRQGIASTPRPSLTPRSSVNPVDSYNVRSGDTMFKIAARVRPDGANIQQTMIAIQQANPSAFIGNNINRLRSNQVLRIPTAEEMRSVNRSAARSAIREQSRQWNEQRAATRKATLTGRASTKPAASSQGPSGRVKLGSDGSDSEEVKSSGASGTGDSLEVELNTSQEELDRAKRENTNLKGRISELEEQIRTMDEMLSITNDELKRLIAVSKQAEAANQIDNQGTADNFDSTNSDGRSVDSLQESDENTDMQPDFNAISDELNEVESPIETPTQTQASGDVNIVRLLMDNIIYVVVGLLALFSIVFVLWRRNKDDDEEDDFDFDTDDGLTAPVDFDQDYSFTDDQDETVFDDEEVEDDGVVEAQTEDVVAEAEIYVSLDQEEKAIELLENEVGENPSNVEARLALLKIFASQQNITAFDTQYADLKLLGNDVANEQAMLLRSAFGDADSYDSHDDDTVSNESMLDEQSLSNEEVDYDFESSEDNGLDYDFESNDGNDEVDYGLESNELDDQEDFEMELDLDLDLDTDNSNDDVDLSEPLELDIDGDELTDAVSDDFDALDIEPDLGESDTHDNSVDFDLSKDRQDVSSDDGTIAVVDDEIELDLPSEDIDIDSLDQELDALTSGLDDDLDFNIENTASDDQANDTDTELQFTGDVDEVETKLDLAKAYLDMGDFDGAREILAEVLEEGNNQQQQEAQNLIDSL